MTATEPHAAVPSERDARSFDDLVADAAEVTRQLAEVPRPRRVLVIPERAHGLVAGLDSYGD